MAQYIIEGGNKLEGEISASGSKNASLPIIAASILNGKNTILYNVPNIQDIKITLEILRILGCKTDRKNGKIIIDSGSMEKTEIPKELMHKLRSSVILAGAVLGRFRKAVFSYPGGCDIGARPIDLHIKSLRKLGINIEEESGYIICSADKIIGADIHLDFPSVGVTENIMLASVLAEGETTITNAAMEPEIVDLQKFLNRMGAKVSGAGENVIRIQGVKELKNVSYNIMPDRIEVGTFLCMTAITGGNSIIHNVNNDDIKSITSKLEEAGAKIKQEKSEIEIIAPKKLKAVDIKTMPYPGFPTDMQSVFGAMLITAKGTSVIVENIFDNRFKYLNELKKMGAKVSVEGKIAIVKGSKRLHGAEMEASDLRGGAALCTAALAARGQSKVDNISHILRGYENFDKKLKKLNAQIKLVQ
ncbi:MAG: UDP-N-acetylglucosamine 1-carboxyvinyltransferase [Clostridia bacterium]